MYLLISILILVTCILLALIVLVQNSKGGGLAANFSSQNQIMGVRKTADFLEKATWTLAIVLLVLSLTSVTTLPKKSTNSTFETQLSTDETIIPMNNTVEPLQGQPAQEATQEQPVE